MLLHVQHEPPESAATCECGSAGCEPPQQKKPPPGTRTLYFSWNDYRYPLLSLSMLVLGWVLSYSEWSIWSDTNFRLLFYTLAWLPVGYPILKKAIQLASRGDVFTEFMLMGMASIGAFYIGEYPEGVAVLLFYTVGELFQEAAVRRARTNIRSLLDVRPDTARIVRGEQTETVDPSSVGPGDRIRILPGERVPLDGRLVSDFAIVDASALTGESIPQRIEKGMEVLSGMLNSSLVIELEVTRDMQHSTVSRILHLVEEASKRKAKTELFIRKFARVYTPLVTFLAAAVVFLPMIWVEPYVFEDWLYRGLVFLVISCPCALVISIPLGYFGGIGAASHHGILVKGGNYLDALLKVDTIIFDKTGTLTHGVFEVDRVIQLPGAHPQWLEVAIQVEAHSTHPIARAIVDHGKSIGLPSVQVNNITEIAGKGMSATINGHQVLVGSMAWLSEQGHNVSSHIPERNHLTAVGVVIGNEPCGLISLGDRLKDEIPETISSLRDMGIRRIAMLSGDREAVVKEVAHASGISEYAAGLLPGDKADYIAGLKQDSGSVVAFVGDGINDAPSLALADVGIAMGGLGSDAAIETADVVLQHDHPKSIIKGIRIARMTRNVVWQNIFLAMGVKTLVMVFGAMGMATLWEAVFADVGVALLAILNAVRIR